MLTPAAICQAVQPILGESQVVLVHIAGRALGPALGRAAGILAGLRMAMEGRTLVAPAFTPQLVDPTRSLESYDSEEDLASRRLEMPSFDRWTLPSGVGRLPIELVLDPRAERSAHPVESIVAIGPLASALVSPHALDDPWDGRSPWARLCALDAQILLIGVDLSRCSILHHAERLALPWYLDRWRYDAPFEMEGVRHWVEVQGGNGCTAGFNRLSPLLMADASMRQHSEPRACTVGRVGAATVHSLSAKNTVEIALQALARDPSALLCEDDGCLWCPHARNELTSRR